ncbi:MAG: FAD-dependent oxidoreductase [Syntrophales bacterium LBB04]|nr:FAD-dependent oxidoreductase [Syntrophales bacterium LBB04]
MKKITIRADVDRTKCVGCGTCVHVCPVSALRPNPDRPLERTKIAPCTANCPAGNDIEGFVRLATQEKFEDALRLLQRTNPFPAITGRVCFHPCEEACNRREFDSPLSILNLERFVSQYESKEQRRRDPMRKEKIAIVGSGPAGLTCAYYLLERRYSVKLFESRSSLGGWLRYGIPEYRLPRSVLDGQISRLVDMGLEAVTNVRVGENVSLDELEDFNAIFIASGRHRSTKLGIPGEDAINSFSGGDFLKRFHSGEAQPLGERVAIIGGGNTAVDAARVALRLGSKPFLVYRRSRDEMPAFKSEVKDMEEEGAQILFLASPARFILDNNRVKYLECLRVELKDSDADGRRRPVPVPGSEFTIEVDSVITASGEEPDLSFLYADLTDAGRIETDRFCRTNREKIFAGGDLTSATGTVPGAIRSGRLAAEAISDYLSSGAIADSPTLEVVKFEQMNGDYLQWRERLTPQRLSPEKALKGFEEICSGYDELTKAADEAGRCMGCASLPLFLPDDCRGCGNCEQRCPSFAITMKPLDTPFTVRVEVSQSDPKKIKELCDRAHLHPESVVCFCTTTRAEEIAAAVLQGATTPEEVSLRTGARTGCSVLCIQPIFRLLRAARVSFEQSRTSDVWYNTIPQIWDLPSAIMEEYDKIGFRFGEDLEFYKKLTGN